MKSRSDTASVGVDTVRLYKMRGIGSVGAVSVRDFRREHAFPCMKSRSDTASVACDTACLYKCAVLGVWAPDLRVILGAHTHFLYEITLGYGERGVWYRMFI